MIKLLSEAIDEIVKKAPNKQKNYKFVEDWATALREINCECRDK